MTVLWLVVCCGCVVDRVTYAAGVSPEAVRLDLLALGYPTAVSVRRA